MWLIKKKAIVILPKYDKEDKHEKKEIEKKQRRNIEWKEIQVKPKQKIRKTE